MPAGSFYFAKLAWEIAGCRHLDQRRSFLVERSTQGVTSVFQLQGKNVLTCLNFKSQARSLLRLILFWHPLKFQGDVRLSNRGDLPFEFSVLNLQFSRLSPLGMEEYFPVGDRLAVKSYAPFDIPGFRRLPIQIHNLR